MLEAHRPRSVIPAKAGIHLAMVIADSEWIPAYAGMTHQDFHEA